MGAKEDAGDEPPPCVPPLRGNADGRAAAALGAFETSPAAVSSCPGFLPLPAARSGEIRLLGNVTLFAQEKPDLCTAGQRMLAGPGSDAFRTDEHPRCWERSPPAQSGGDLAPPPASSGQRARQRRPLPTPQAAATASLETGDRGASASPPARCPVCDRAPAVPSLSPAYLSGPAAEGLAPPPTPAPHPVSAMPAEGASHAAAPAEPRLSPCAHSAGAGSSAGFIRGQRRLRAAARLAANAAARLTLPRPGVVVGG